MRWLRIAFGEHERWELMWLYSVPQSTIVHNITLRELRKTFGFKIDLMWGSAIAPLAYPIMPYSQTQSGARSSLLIVVCICISSYWLDVSEMDADEDIAGIPWGLPGFFFMAVVLIAVGLMLWD